MEKQAVSAAFGSLTFPFLMHTDIGTILVKSAPTEGNMSFYMTLILSTCQPYQTSSLLFSLSLASETVHPFT